MASSIIHIAVANEINKEIKRDKTNLLIGSIAPDLSKIIGETKKKSHFLDNDDNIPNMYMFLKKYHDKLNDDFVLGYFIHLYTDYLWFKYFITDVLHGSMITQKDGTTVMLNEDMIKMYIYNDYTNLNIQLIEKYNLDLKIFYNDIPKINNIINEIPMDKLNLLIEKAGVIIENSKEGKNYVFDIFDICKFIDTTVNLILAKLNEYQKSIN